MKKYISIIMIMSFVIVGCSVFKDKENVRCEKAIKIFQKACNELNDEKIYKCIYKEYIDCKLVDSDYLNKKIYMELDNFLNSFFSSFMIDMDKKEILETLNIEIIDSSVFLSRVDARIKCILKFKIDNIKQKREAKIKMKKIDGEWYISTIDNIYS